MTLGHRMSSAPVTQFCGQAGRLGQMGSGRAAYQSSCFHAVCAGAPNADELLVRLTQDELAEIAKWKRPTDIDVGSGRILRYVDAEKELEVAIDSSGSYVDPKSPNAISIGHFDFGWVVQVGSMRIAYVGDIKRSEFTVEEGVESLQLHSYGLAYATKMNCDGYAVGIWAAVEGLWQWSSIVDLESAEALTYAKRVVAAVTNTSDEYAMGPHCRKCYGRFRCPAWLMPPELATSTLAPLAVGGEAQLTDERMAELLLVYQRFSDTTKRMEEAFKAYALQHRGIRDPKTGKVWLPVLCQGRESVSVEAVRREFGDDADRVISKGKPYQQFRWTNGART